MGSGQGSAGPLESEFSELSPGHPLGSWIAKGCTAKEMVFCASPVAKIHLHNGERVERQSLSRSEPQEGLVCDFGSQEVVGG